MLVGELAKAGKLVRVERIVASSEEILDALFERTYARLSPAARWVFLTLSSRRSLVPQLAIEAALLRPINERIDVGAAVEELHRSSFVEKVYAPDGTAFLAVPFVTSVFGKKKLAVSSMRPDIQADNAFMQLFGAMQPADARHGIGPRVERFFKGVTDGVAKGRLAFGDHVSVLELVARRYPRAWLPLANLYEESGLENSLALAREAVQLYLESTSPHPDQTPAWERLSRLCQRSEDWVGAVDALEQISTLPGVEIRQIRRSASNLSLLLRSLNTNGGSLDSVQKHIAAARVATLLEGYIADGDASDHAKLGSLQMQLGNIEKARKYVQLGLKLDSGNEHCLRLFDQLKRPERQKSERAAGASGGW
jgi:hypothetical protein